MTVASGGTVYGSDFNVIQNLVVEVLGSGLPYGPTGSGDVTYGYGQTLQSSQVSAGSLITAAQWNALANDVNIAYTHQNGSSFSGYTNPIVSTGTVVTSAMYNQLYNTMSALVSSRQTVAAAQLATSSAGSATYGSQWGNGSSNQGITHSGSMTFASANALQYFWNTGGSISFQGVGPNQSGSTQDADWQAALTAFNYTLNYSNVWGGSNAVIQTFQTQPSPYNNSYIQLSGYISGGVINWTVHYEDAVPTNWNSTWSPSTANKVSPGAGYTVYVSEATGALPSPYNYSSISISGGWSLTA
jgi:hypothetical protein